MGKTSNKERWKIQGKTYYKDGETPVTEDMTGIIDEIWNMSNPKGETFKLWCYLNKNQNGYTLALSKVDALRWGIGSKSSYDRAIAELIQKGYLVNT